MPKLTPEQNAALGDLNAALYKSKNTGLLALLPAAQVADDFYNLVGKLCADNRDLGDGAPSVQIDPNAIFTSKISVELSGLTHEDAMVIDMGAANPDLYEMRQLIDEFPQREIVEGYRVTVSRANMASVDIFLHPDTPVQELLPLAHQIMFCRIPATLRRQAWVNDHAVDIDDGEVCFNAMANLIKMDLEDVQDMFAAGRAFGPIKDALANGLPEREAHEASGGPFEVDVQEEDVVRMVCLLSSMHGALSENDSVSDIKQPMWDDFVVAAHQLLQINGGDLYGQLAVPEQEVEAVLDVPGDAQ